MVVDLAGGRPVISFIIPVRDDAVRLARCLASIRQVQTANLVEIIVVDNGSRDDSAGVGRRVEAHVITLPRRPVAELRNRGAAAAGAELLAFVDADHELPTGWIDVAIENLSHDPHVAATGASYRAPLDGTWVQRAYDELRGTQIGRRPVEWLGAGNMVVRRDAFEQVGGFDVTLQTCEDVDLCKRLRAAGYELLGDERLVNVHHGDPATLGALFRGELWRGRSNLAVSLRAPRTLHELPSAIAPVAQLAGLAGAAAGTLFGGAAAAWLIALGLLPSALVPVLRTVRNVSRARHISARQFADNIVVAFVYDLARALALVAFARHAVRRT